MMGKLHAAFALLIGISLCSVAPGWGAGRGPQGEAPRPDPTDAAAREILARLDERLQRIATMRGRFVQTFISSGLGIPQSEQGRFALQRPDLTWWDYTSPERKLAVSDGVNTWLHMPEDGVVYRGTVAEWRRHGAFALLAGGRLADCYEATGVEAEGAGRRGNVLLELKLRSPGDDLRAVIVEIEPRSLSVAAITAVDGMGNRIGLAFSDVEENVELPPGLFRFTPPPGVRILEQDPGAPGP